MARTTTPVAERFAAKLHIDTEVGCVGKDGNWSPCVQWTGAISSTGYGNLKVEGQTVLAHRLSYQMAYGRIPEGMVLDHLCSRRRCTNPLHLDPVPQRENVRRGASPVGAKMREMGVVVEWEREEEVVSA
jgi:hypothetical protein